MLHSHISPKQFAASRRLIQQLFPEPLTIQLGNHSYQFHTLTSFEFCLAGRTTVPLARITQLFRHSTATLQAEAQQIRHMENRIVNALSHDLADPSKTASLTARYRSRAVFQRSQLARDLRDIESPELGVQ